MTTSFPTGRVGAARYGFGHALDAAAAVLYTQSGSNPVESLDIAKNATLPALHKTAGTRLLCLHFDSVSGELGAIVRRPQAQTMQLVSVDTTGADEANGIDHTND